MRNYSPLQSRLRNLRILRPLAIGLLVAGGLLACVAGTFSMRANRLTVLKKNDVPRGDEPYMATIRFKAVYASSGSTQVVVDDSLQTLAKQLRPGRSEPASPAASRT